MNIRIGSSKVMTSVEQGVIEMRFTDRWSARDRGSSNQEIPGIGIARCMCAVKSFELARAAGLPTHFIEQISPNTIHVEEYALPGKESLSGKTHGRVLPAEWIWRMYVAGSLIERLKSEELKPEDVGFVPGARIIEGMKLPRMLKECTTKFENADRHLSETQTRELVGVSDAQWQKAWELIEHCVELTNAHFTRAGFRSPDGKFELLLTRDGTIKVGDVFGTQDENRLIDATTGEHFDKDIIRNYLAASPWKKKLDLAKKEHPNDKSKWPKYPRLPTWLIDCVSQRYVEVADRYTQT